MKKCWVRSYPIAEGWVLDGYFSFFIYKGIYYIKKSVTSLNFTINCTSNLFDFIMSNLGRWQMTYLKSMFGTCVYPF